MQFTEIYFFISTSDPPPLLPGTPPPPPRRDSREDDTSRPSYTPGWLVSRNDEEDEHRINGDMNARTDERPCTHDVSNSDHVMHEAASSENADPYEWDEQEE